MRKTKVVLVLAVLGILVFAMAAESMAAWYVVSISQTGKNEDGNVYFRGTHTAATPLFTNQLFKAPVGNQNQYLAIGLAAQAMIVNVGICATVPPGANVNTAYPVTCMYLQ